VRTIAKVVDLVRSEHDIGTGAGRALHLDVLLCAPGPPTDEVVGATKLLHLRPSQVVLQLDGKFNGALFGGPVEG
jgi:hypothetical protein